MKIRYQREPSLKEDYVEVHYREESEGCLHSFLLYRILRISMLLVKYLLYRFQFTFLQENYVFNNSVHSPIFEEPEAAFKLVEEILEVE